MKRFLSTTLIVSLLAFSLSTSAREHVIFGGLSYLQTEAVKQQLVEEPPDSEPSEPGEEEEVTTSTEGARVGLRVFYQTFEDEGVYVGAGFERADGDYDRCIQEDCIGITQTVNDLNIELGWSSANGWTPFVKFERSDTESDAPIESDTDAELDIGIGMYYRTVENIRMKLNINGLHDSDKLAFGAGFQRKFENDIVMEGTFSFPVADDLTGYGFTLAFGRKL